MKFGGPFPWQGRLATPENMITAAKAVERLGFDYVWMGDHLMLPKVLRTRYPYTADGKNRASWDRNFFEMVVTAAHVSAHTTTLRFHSNIMILPLRTPFLVARQLASLDALAKGRFTAVFGLSWMKDEYDALGLPWSKRGAMMDDGIDALRALFAEEAHHGPYYDFEASWLRPHPVQDPYPIWIGGDSNAAMRRVALRGDGWAPHVARGPEGCARLKQRLSEIAQIRAKAGAPAAPLAVAAGIGEILVNGPLTRFSEKRDYWLEEIAGLEEAGVTHVSANFNEINVDLPLQAVLDEAQWFAEEIIAKTRSPASGG
ncbi:MAG: TIGR03619 family F420-dependent LLM class oxidoreductase [Caulobacteraceae bacterium]|nr:TIGR03619 family F420-dependent LLM class oxidoreductase [Caulobacteraceae bacterium]